MKTNSGFMALISAIIISILLLGVTLTISLTGFFSRFNVLDSESKERSIGLAEACVDAAVLDYTTNDTIASEYPVEGETCYIKDWSDISTTLTLITQGEVNSAYTNIKVVIKLSDMSIISWEEK